MKTHLTISLRSSCLYPSSLRRFSPESTTSGSPVSPAMAADGRTDERNPRSAPRRVASDPPSPTDEARATRPPPPLDGSSPPADASGDDAP